MYPHFPFCLSTPPRISSSEPTIKKKKKTYVNKILINYHYLSLDKPEKKRRLKLGTRYLRNTLVYQTPYTNLFTDKFFLSYSLIF